MNLKYNQPKNLHNHKILQQQKKIYIMANIRP